MRRLIADRIGATAAEHALLLALVMLVALGGWAALGGAAERKTRCVASVLGGDSGPCDVGATDGTAHGLDRTLGDRAGRARDVERALASLPARARRALERQGTRIVVTDQSVAEAMPASLRDRRARGWPRGTTFADVQAVYLPGSNRVIVAAGALGDRLDEALTHELGHALDLGRGLSGSEAFRTALASTRAGDLNSYYTQPGRAGREETYAESFALYASDRDALRERAPALYAYWEARARRAFGQRSDARLGRAGTEARPFDFGVGLVRDKVGAAGHVVSRAVETFEDQMPLRALAEHGPGLLSGAARWAYGETPLGDGMRATWNALPASAQGALRRDAGFAVGVGQFATSLAELALRYAPPYGAFEALKTVSTAAAHPGRTAATIRAMPSSTASYYSALARDLVSDDPFVSGRAAGRLSGEVATLFVPGGAIAGRGATTARAGWTAARASRVERLAAARARARDPGLAQRFEQNATTIRANKFNTFRGIDAYRFELGEPFIDRLRALGPAEHWVDMGAGDANAMRHFLSRPARTGGAHPRTTAIGYEPPPNLAELQAHPGFRAINGRLLDQIAPREIGRADLVTDNFGPAMYSPHLDDVVSTYGRIARPGSDVFFVVDGATIGMRMAQQDFLRAWLGRARGFEIVSIEKRTRGAGSTVHLRRTADRLRVPPLVLTRFVPRTSVNPLRTYTLGR